LIVAATGEDEPHVVVEGHTRATAYVRGLLPDAEVEVIAAYSPAIASWAFY